MRRTDVHFLIFHPQHTPIANGVQYAIRHEVASLFQISGFGQILSVGDNLFENEFAVPVEDQVIDNEISIYYSFGGDEYSEEGRHIPLTNIARFQNLIEEQYHMEMIIHFRYVS